MNKSKGSSLLTVLLLFTLCFAAMPQTGYAQAVGQSAAATDYSKQLQTIEEKTDARRRQLGIPGMSLVIVKDDQIIFMKGLGYKDFENQVPVTPDTQFAIGSATKAFTALSALISMDEGKLSLEDSPKKYLPYFKMYDPDTDKNITIRDLMCHSSGLNRTDLAMVTGKLNRAELIQVAAQAKPTAKLREKFQYQNIMFTAAGEIVATVQKEPWEKFVPERIFAPIGMTNSTMSLAQMKLAKDYSYGYNYNFDTKKTEKLPFRDIDQVAPAGSINSSARDMAEWLRLVMNGGTAHGKRLMSEKAYDEWLKPQMKIAGSSSYGFGWFLQSWNGLKVVQHGGNIDGFNSMVAMIPEKKLGFVMLTNVSASSLGGELMPIVWQNLLGENKPDENVKLPVKTMEKMVGKYHLDKANIDAEVKIVGEDLVIVLPGQPPYTLQRTGPRQFHLANLPDDFGAKFTPEEGDATELTLTQPGHSNTFKRIGADTGVTASPATPSAGAKELIGKYVTASGQGEAEIKESDGKVSFSLGNEAFVLADKSRDVYSLVTLPDSYWLTAKRDAAGKITSVVITQPEGDFEFLRKDSKPADPIKMTTDELYANVIKAAGGDANLRKIKSRVYEFTTDLENQGVQAHGHSYSKAPNKTATETVFTALGKEIGTEWEYFDGTGGADTVSFAPPTSYSGKQLEDVRLGADFWSILNWNTNYKKIEITGMAKVGDEDAYVVAFESEKGTPFKEYYSAKSYLLLKREGVIGSSTSSQQIPYSVLYADYRPVDGIMLPFKTTSNNIGNGNIVTTIKTVKHNVPVDDKMFAARKFK